MQLPIMNEESTLRVDAQAQESLYLIYLDV